MTVFDTNKTRGKARHYWDMKTSLTDRYCKTVTEEGKHTDGGGLCLHVKGGRKYWRLNYRFGGKQKTASLGVYPAVSLKEARALAAEKKALLAQGIDPNAARQEAKEEARIDASAAFATVAAQWFENVAKARAWGDKHRLKVRRQLDRHILPALGDMDIRELHPQQIVVFVQGIERAGIPTTAHDCLDLIRRICAHAVQMGIRETSPAAHLKDVLGKVESQPMRHITDPDRIGEILLTLERAQTLLPATKAYARLLPILFTRPSELRLMRWAEIDGDLWTKPAATMKKRRAHLVPLPRQAVAILDGLRLFTGQHEYAFTNGNSGKPITDGALQRLLIRNGLHDDITWHGWRHTASTLLNEQGFNRDHIEIQLSHADGNKVRGTYNHAQYLEDRRAMLQRWADYLDDLKARALAKESTNKNTNTDTNSDTNKR